MRDSFANVMLKGLLVELIVKFDRMPWSEVAVVPFAAYNDEVLATIQLKVAILLEPVLESAGSYTAYG